MANNRRGSALLTVLWLTAALAAVGLAVANNVRGETERAATNVDDVKSYFIARGGVERAALYYLWGRDFYLRGTPSLDFDFPGGTAHVDIIPESSRLGLNAARPEELMRLLMALGVTESSAGEIVAAIIDWRTADPLHQSPFDAFYLAQIPSFLPRHASFLENEELLQVKGITPDLYFGSSLDNSHAGLRDCVSVYSTGGQLDINTAQPASLQAIGLAPADVAAIVKTRAQRPILEFQQLSALVEPMGPAGARLGVGGQTIYTFRATARLRQPDGKLSYLRRTVGAQIKFNLPGNPQNKTTGFEILRWFDRA
jgi:general secretion pathway protein K